MFRVSEGPLYVRAWGCESARPDSGMGRQGRSMLTAGQLMFVMWELQLAARRDYRPTPHLRTPGVSRTPPPRTTNALDTVGS